MMILKELPVQSKTIIDVDGQAVVGASSVKLVEAKPKYGRLVRYLIVTASMLGSWLLAHLGMGGKS